MAQRLQETKTYYNSSQWLYRTFFYNLRSLGKHHGFWDRDTKNIHEAMLNENQVIIDLANIKSSQNVLDAGCGVGGTAIYIAKKTGANVCGISVIPKEIRLAKKYAQKKAYQN